MCHNIAFSGGGVHTIAFIGCLKYLEETEKIEHIHNVIGSSGGSFGRRCAGNGLLGTQKSCLE